MRRLTFALLFVACGPPATLTRVQQEVFTPSCNFSSCHLGAGNNGLNLEAPVHDKIVNKAAVGPGASSGLKLVVPGKPEESYLYQKLTQEVPAAGVRMPNTGDALDVASLQLVKDWIAGGAQDN
jgi:hypothetical protein